MAADFIVVIPCGAKKRPGTHKARDLYIGSYFIGCLRYALSIAPENRVFILSGKYGLLRLGDVVESYEMMLGQPGSVTLARVKVQAVEFGLQDCPVIAVAGSKYAGMCKAVWKHTTTPLAGVGGFGKQLQWMKQHRGRVP